MIIDTHSHIYGEEFDADFDHTIQKCITAGVEKIILPNIDSDSLSRLEKAKSAYPNLFYLALGVHPTSINGSYKEELAIVESVLNMHKAIAIGEIGLDLYWDKTFLKEQIDAFKTQLDWAIKHQLPVIIHQREALNETIEVLSEYKNKNLRGVFHSFTGNTKEAKTLLQLGDFYLGINGIVTFKNAKLAETLQDISLDKIVVETDSPYLAPSPHRGKRNEPSYLTYICSRLAEIYKKSNEEVAAITTQNAIKLFKI